MDDYTYPSRHDMKQVMSKDFVSAKFLCEFAQKKGIFIFRADQEKMTDFLSSLFYENQELELLRDRAFDNSPERKLSKFQYVDEKEGDEKLSPVDAIDKYIKELAAQGSNPDNIEIANPILIKEGVHEFRVKYTQNKKGRVGILQKEKHDFMVTVEQESSSTYSITVDSTSSSDQKFTEGILKTHLKSNGSFRKIELDKLKSSNTIAFFDDLSTEAMGKDWNLVEVTKLVLRKPDNTEEEEDKKSTLQGITQAILEGEDLRGNSFVKDCEDNNYRFTAMTYKFEHKNEPYIIEISAQSKGRPKVFEVAIINYKIKEFEANTSNEILTDADYPEQRMEIKKGILSAAERIYKKYS